MSIVDIETQLTKDLFAIEQFGLKVALQRINDDLVKFIPYRSELRKKIRQLTGMSHFDPEKPGDYIDLICGRYSMQALEWTKGGKDRDERKKKPSFSEYALEEYKRLFEQNNDEKMVEAIGYMLEYKKLTKLQKAFTIPFAHLYTGDGLIHCTYNQCVRTGRMSCNSPNMQQLSPEAKEYIIPRSKNVFMEYDLSQIEYRVIAHYLKNQRILEEYQKNPNADYHQVMANLCGIDRKQAKNMNFAVSFGAGKAKTIAMLKDSFDPSNVPEGRGFDEYCTEKGYQIYETYHQRVPELKNMIWRTSNAVRRRAAQDGEFDGKGWVKNMFGRIRRLDNRFHYKAFNAIVQSSAADIMKKITIELSSLFRGTPLHIVAIVHDSWLIECPSELVEEYKYRIQETIEGVETPLSVPIYSSCSISEGSWAGC